MKLVDPSPCTRSTTTSDQDRASPSLEERLPAREVAKILGVKVATLAKWRQRGKGPVGWLYLTPTLVVYAISAVEKFLKERETHVPKDAKGGDKA